MPPIKQKLNRPKNQDKSENGGRSNRFQETYIHPMIDPIFIYSLVRWAISPRHVSVKFQKKSRRN